MTTSATLGKSHHKVLRFHYTVDNSKNDSMKLELQRVDWYEVFHNSSSTEWWGKFKYIINNLISKFFPLQKQTRKKKKKSIWTNKLTLSKDEKQSLTSVLENERPTRLPNVLLNI